MPVAECRCGLPGANSTHEVWPGEAAEVECHNWWVPGGRGRRGGHGQDRAVPVTQPQGERGALNALALGSGPLLTQPLFPFSTCVNGTLACPVLACPSYGPWSAWSPCSSTCGGGRTSRHRACLPSPGGVPCADTGTQETAKCSPQPCSGERPSAPPALAPAPAGPGRA